MHGCFLGSNGSGRCLTIRVLLGPLRPTSGTTVLLGGDPWAQAIVLHVLAACVVIGWLGELLQPLAVVMDASP